MVSAKAFGKATREFLEHPFTSLVVGVVLAASGVDDLMEALAEGDTGLGVHHGMIVFGVSKVLAALAEALERVGKVAERID